MYHSTCAMIYSTLTAQRQSLTRAHTPLCCAPSRFCSASVSVISVLTHTQTPETRERDTVTDRHKETREIGDRASRGHQTLTAFTASFTNVRGSRASRRCRGAVNNFRLSAAGSACSGRARLLPDGARASFRAHMSAVCARRRGGLLLFWTDRT